MTKIFITGATGYVGKDFTRLLVQNNQEVVSLVRETSDTTDLNRLGVEYVIGNLLEVDTYEHSLYDSDIVVHLAATVHVGAVSRKHKKEMYQTNVIGSEKLFNEFIKSELERLIFVSSRQIYGDTNGVGNELSAHDGINQSYYAYTKHLGHLKAKQLIEKDYPITIITPGTVYGNDPCDNGIGYLFQRYCKKNIPIIMGNPINSYVFLPDLSQALFIASQKTLAIGQEYIITNGAIGLLDLLDIFEQITGINQPKRKIKLTKKRNRIFLKTIAIINEQIAKLKGTIPLISREIIANMSNNCVLSNKKSIDELGVKYENLEKSMNDAFSKQHEKYLKNI